MQGKLARFLSVKLEKQLHIGFEDTAEVTGTEQEIISIFRKVRDEIKNEFYKFYEDNLRSKENVKY